MSVLKVKVGNEWVGIPSIKGDTGATGPQGPKGDPGTPADPTVLIDDNVGQGATNKTWSADKITGEFESVDEKINSGLGAYYIDKSLFTNPTAVNSNASSVINAAILTAQEKQLTFCIIPEGEYWLTSTIYLKSNVILCGNGMDSTILKIADGCDIDAIRVSEPTNNAGIMDLAIDGNRIQNYSTYANGHHGNAINVWLHYGILERVRTNWVFKHSLLLNYDTGNSDDGLGFAPEHQNDMGNLNRVLWCDFKDSLLQGIMWGWRTMDSWMCYTNIGSHAANLYLEGGTSRFIGNHFDGDGDNGAGPEYNVYCGDGCDTMFFDENIFENTQKENIYFRKPSYSNKTRTISINNNIIRTCSKSTNNTYANIKIVGYDSNTKASNITIANNQILNPDLSENHGYAGIHLDYCDDVKIEGNVFYNVGNDRVIIEDTCTNIIFDEEISNELTTVKSAIQQLPDVKSTVESSADLYLCDENGNVIAEFKDGHIVTKNFDSANGGLIADTVQSTADLYVCDANGNVIAEFANGHIKTKNFDSSATATGGILNRMNKQTDGVYAACRWHQPNLSSKQFCLLVSGDSHGDSTRVESMIEYLNSIDAFDACVMAGDMSGNTFSDSISYYLTALESAQKPVITSLGNHDTVGATSDTDLWTKYGDCFQYADLASGEAVSGKCYYHKDFTDQKIRIIVLMQYDYTYEGELCFGQDQIDWFIDVLNDTPTDYGVIIVEHTNASRYMTYNMDESVTSSTWAQSNYAPTVMSGDPVPDIVDAWINGTTLSQTYSYTFDNPPSDLEVSADFTSRGAGEFITYIGGHWHMNVLGTPTAYTDQPDFHVPANGMIHATQGDMPRREGTVSEDSFCALAVDRNKKTVKIFQLGAHWTKDAVNRQFFKYSYGS